MPDVSVTIAPTGYAHQIAREIIDVLHQECGGPTCHGFDPHVTMQYVRDASDLPAIVRTLESVCAETRPFAVRFGALGTFDTVPGVHVTIDPSRELIDLYVRIKSALKEIGASTYDYDAETWRPHLTLSCRHWSPEQIEVIRSTYRRIDASFVARCVDVNLLEQVRTSERWVRVGTLPFRVERPRTSLPRERGSRLSA